VSNAVIIPTLPLGIEPAVQALGQEALLLGLLCVGATIDPTWLGQDMRLAGATCAAAFITIPLADRTTLRGVRRLGPAAGIARLFSTMPTTPSADILTR